MDVIDIAVVIGLFWFCYLGHKLTQILEKDLEK